MNSKHDITGRESFPTRPEQMVEEHAIVTSEQQTGIQLQYVITANDERTSWAASYLPDSSVVEKVVEPGKYTLIEVADCVEAEKVLRPAERLCSLPEHPGVATVFAVVTVDGQHKIWLEQLPGGSLERLLDTRGRLEGGEVATLAQGLADGLKWIQTQQMAYQQLTAQDIAFTAAGEVKFLPPTIDLRGESETTQNDLFARNIVQAAEIIWTSICGEGPGAERQRVPLPMSFPEYGKELGPALENCIDRQRPQPRLQEIAAMVRAAFSPCSLNLFESAHPSETHLLTSVPAGEPLESSYRKRREEKTVRSAVLTVGGKTGDRKRGILVGACAVAVLLALGGWWFIASLQQDGAGQEATLTQVEASTGGQQTPSVEQTESVPIPIQQLTGLLETRNKAFNTSDSAQVLSYAVEGSALAVADQAMIESDTENILETAKLSIQQAQVITETAETVVIDAEVLAEGYIPPANSSDLENTGVEVIDGRARQKVTFTLVFTGQGWKMESAVPQTR